MERRRAAEVGIVRVLAEHRWGAWGWAVVAALWLVAGGAQLVDGSPQIGAVALVLAGLFGLLASRAKPRS